MKPNFKILLIAALLVTAPLFMFAQHPPSPGDTPPLSGKEVGGPPAGAPIGNGTVILLTLAAAYALRKAYEWRQAKDEVTE
jgi:hypothetical protein